jgi:hypothetical protein
MILLGVELEHALADIHAKVGDALEVGHHLEHQRDEAQVRGHGLPPGENLQAQTVQLDLHAVDDLVRGDGPVGQLAVAFDEGLDAVADDALDVAAHDQQLLAQLAQFVLVLSVGVLTSKHGVCPRRYPKRPVM